MAFMTELITWLLCQPKNTCDDDDLWDDLKSKNSPAINTIVIVKREVYSQQVVRGHGWA